MKDKIISLVIGILVGFLAVFGYNTFLGTGTDTQSGPGAGSGERPDMSDMSEEEISEMKASRESMRGGE